MVKTGQLGHGRDGNNVSSRGNVEYDFVLNNWTENEYELILQNLKMISDKYIVAKEVGEQGTPHLQCYIKLKTRTRITTLHNIDAVFKRCSFRPARNAEALKTYCQKGGNFVSQGIPKPITIIQTLHNWQQEIYNIFLSEPDNRKIYWYWEDKGNIGKSSFVKYMLVKHKSEALAIDGGKKADVINLLYNSDLSEFKALFIDIPRASFSSVSYSAIEAIKNGIIFNSKFECGTKVFNPPHIFIFCNYEPAEKDLLSSDRWNVTKL